MIIIFLLLVSITAFAEQEVGNGGNGQVCYDKQDKIVSARLLDFYERGSPWKENSGLKDPDSYIKIVERKLKQLETLAPALAKEYQRRFSQIKSEITFTDEKLVSVKDSKHLTKPKKETKCKVEQAVIRKKMAVKEHRFIFQKDIWKKFDSVNKAGILLHEIVYENLVLAGEFDSRNARWLTSELFDANFDKASKDEFWKMIKERRIPIYKEIDSAN